MEVAMRYKPPSIAEEGIDAYLDRTAGRHNNMSAIQFRRLVLAGVNIANLARAMNVKNRETIKRWLALLS